MAGNKEKITGLLKSLKELRWDEMTEEEIKAAWDEFANSGCSREFYIYTLSMILNGGLKSEEEFVQKRTAAIKAMCQQKAGMAHE